MRIYGTLEEQLARCEACIAECAAKLADPNYKDVAGAGLGWADALLNREYILAEMAAERKAA